jgi:hypothetical protein
MARTRIQANRQREHHIPAPIGGVNSVSAGTDMPATDCIQSYNMIGAEYGLRSRLGYREWATNLGGQVRSILPFTGSVAAGTNDKLFACTETGIWDVSSSTAAPSQVLHFGTHGTDAGWGVSTVFVTLAGHFLVYCDEANGMLVYCETNATWVTVGTAASTAWAAGTAYGLGTKVTNSGVSYNCSKAGNSAAAPATGPAGTGTAITDGTVEWDYYATISGVDPTHLVSVTAWKNRLWFVEKDTGNGWYLDASAIYGVAHRFQFGNRFKAGGDLRGLWSWTYDGGSGIDDALVAVSGGGDVLVYRGTDPAEAGAFSLVGVWFVGAVPSGRRLCTDYGGDLLLMSSIGIMPMSTLVTGKSAVDRTQYRTAKVSNLFNVAQTATSSQRGWAMVLHPEDACLMVLAPGSQSKFVMSMSTQGWHLYDGLPETIAAAPWDGTLFFGTSDGKVYSNTGYQDDVKLIRTWVKNTVYVAGEWVTNNSITYRCTVGGTSEAGASPTGPTGNGSGIADGTCTWTWDTGISSPIEWSLLTSFSNLGSIRHKRVHTIRVRTLSQGEATPLLAEARYGFDFSVISGNPVGSLSGGSVWDTSKWDSAVWSGEYAPAVKVFGANGCGSEVAIAIKGRSSARTTLVGIDAVFDVGGVL